MINIYVISLANEVERRQHMREQCYQYGLHIELVDAFDMRQVTEAEIEHLSSKITHTKPKKHRYLTRGELGCALSHQAVYRKALAQGLDYCLVLEDDAQFIVDPRPLLDVSHLNAIQLQYPFDVLILGYVKTLPEQLPYYYRRIPLKKRAELVIHNQTWLFGTPWEQYACGTVAYIISCVGMQKILSVGKPCCTADDWLFFERYQNLRVLHCRPTLVLEALQQFESTIRHEQADYLNIKLSSRIIRSIKGSLKNIIMNYLS